MAVMPTFPILLCQVEILLLEYLYDFSNLKAIKHDHFDIPMLTFQLTCC